MRVTVVVRMVMIMRVIMTVIVPAMRVIVVMPVMVVVMHRRIGAAFRLKRCFDQRRLCAERGEQGLDRVIAPRADTVGQQLHRHMAVTKMPGQPRQRGDIGGARLDQRLGRRHDFDQCTILKHQEVVGAQPHGAMQIDLHRAAFDARNGHMTGAALGVIEDHGVGHRPVVAKLGGDDAGCARHGQDDFRWDSAIS
jgi:hypothetical protein